MRLLLDTHLLLWWLKDDPLLPPRAGALIEDRRNQVFVSPMSLWEEDVSAHWAHHAPAEIGSREGTCS